MAAGIIFGGVPTVFEYLNPLSGNPWIRAFYVSVIGQWVIGAAWIYFADGARVIGSLSKPPRSPVFIRVSYATLPVVGALAVMILATMRGAA